MALPVCSSRLGINLVIEKASRDFAASKNITKALAEKSMEQSSSIPPTSQHLIQHKGSE